MNRFIGKTVIFCFVMLFTACVEEYNIPQATLQNYESEIVIQGRILSGEESVFYISYTTPFNHEESLPPITDAKIRIIGQNGYNSALAEYDSENDCYLIDTKDLDSSTLYSVEIYVNEETYQSDFLYLLDTPEIDEVTYKEQADGISIHVTSQDNGDASRHYMWGYEEDWEFHADINPIQMSGRIPIYNKEFYPLLTSTTNPYYYCWIHNNSKNIHIYSTSELNENSVKDVELIQIPINDIRISYIYSILVKQWSLSDEAYNYYKTLKLYTEESGGLFTPMPSEITGNITCTSNPDKKVRGYILASKVTTKRMFVYESDFKNLRTEYENCFMMTANQTLSGTMAWDAYVSSFAYIVMSTNGKIHHHESVLYHKTCVDCRQTKGATKKRPDFWPNNDE